MYAERQSATQTMNLIVKTVQELSLARDLDTVMKIVRTVARKLTGADGATFVLREGNLCFYADEDAISPLWKGSRFPMSTCISGWVMLHRRTAVIEDIFLDDRIPHDAYRPTFVKSLAMVPIRTIDPIGAIGNYWANNHLPTEEEVTLLQALADITAVTIENVNVYRELEQRVKDRTAELEAAISQLEAFSYSVSHDLRIPLRSIIRYAEMFSDSKVTERLAKEESGALASIGRNARKMNNLIDDLLKFSQASEGDLNKQEIDMSQFVKALLEDINQSFPNVASITVSDLNAAKADKNLLAQVWTNLICNAIKYSSKKTEAKIEIGSYRGEKEIIFFVKDNGAGFKNDYANKLFTPFQRLHSTTEFQGSGIGLALVSRIVMRHGGKVWATGEENKGATFYFSLPF